MKTREGEARKVRSILDVARRPVAEAYRLTRQ